ncbi:gamma-glutamyltransferase family protein [Thermodesulfobacteriota bacterium]
MKISWQFPYPSRRMPVFARNVVATSQPLAAQAGLRMLMKGGNAVDAALATAIALTIVEPTSNGIGSDAFALIWISGKLFGLNGSGKSPRAWTYQRFSGLREMPKFGWDSVTVPGAVHAWFTLSNKFGKLPFADLFVPGIEYAQKGFLVSPITAARWSEAQVAYQDFPDFRKTFLPIGTSPLAGELFCCPDQATTLAAIAESHGDSFYKGGLADKIVECAGSNGGAITRKDLANHKSEWVDPISIDYRERCLHEIPPNGQGLAALMALGILRYHQIEKYPVDSADSVHLQIEAMKIAFVEAHRHIADPEYMLVPSSDFLQADFLAHRAKQIKMDRASHHFSMIPTDYGTVYLSAADKDGMMVSFIQSNYLGFGSGIVIPNTGISMQNRGFGFVIEEGHPNCVGGGKRPYHTIIPGFVTHNDRPLMSFGVMGGYMQPQGHVQMIVRIFDYAQNPQTACDAPRWMVNQDLSVSLESGFSSDVIEELRNRGHKILPTPHHFSNADFGGAQLIFCLDDGYCAASDSRKDGQALGF